MFYGIYPSKKKQPVLDRVLPRLIILPFLYRRSVLDAITVVKQRLKLYRNVPPNGLAIYCGSIFSGDGKEKMETYDFEPFKPIGSFLYKCDKIFHTDRLNDWLQGDETSFGFIIIDGNGTLFGSLQV